MKDYLNSEERNIMMMIGSMVRTFKNTKPKTDPFSEDSPRLVDIAESWDSRGNITKDEKRSIKMASTYFEKFFKSVFNRLSKSEQDKIRKKLSSFGFRYLDDYTLQKFYKDFDAEHVNLKREEFYAMYEQLAEINCKGCTKNHSECKLHEILEYNLVPETTWDLPNCRYAYADITREESNKMRKKLGLKPLPIDWDKNNFKKEIDFEIKR